MRGNARTDLRSNERARKGDEVANDNRLENTAHNAECLRLETFTKFSFF